MALMRALAPAIDLVFPPRCPACGAAVAGQDGLCGTCFGEIVVPGAPACRLCQVMFVAVVPEDGVCARCRAEPPQHAGIVAATLYNDRSRALVLALKYRRQIALVPMMARMLAGRVAARHGHRALDGWLVMPVPLHRWRLWRRGFNQSALLAAALVRQAGGDLVVDGLVRHRATPPLHGLDAEARAGVMAGAIGLHRRHAHRVSGAQVLVVDDILTSGATSTACVAALMAAGAREVRIACFARVMSAHHDAAPAAAEVRAPIEI